MINSLHIDNCFPNLREAFRTVIFSKVFDDYQFGNSFTQICEKYDLTGTEAYHILSFTHEEYIGVRGYIGFVAERVFNSFRMLAVVKPDDDMQPARKSGRIGFHTDVEVAENMLVRLVLTCDVCGILVVLVGMSAYNTLNNSCIVRYLTRAVKEGYKTLTQQLKTTTLL